MTITGRVDISAQKSTNYLIMGWWSNTTSYKLSDAGVPVVKVPDGTQLGYSVYALTVETSTVGASPAGSGASQWKLIESAEFIYMQEAYIERLQAAIVTAEKIEALMIRTKNLEVIEGAKVGGFNIGSGRIGVADNPGNTGMRLYNEFVKFSDGNAHAMLGTNVLPSATGTSAMLTLEDNKPGFYGNKWGAVISVSGNISVDGSNPNIALDLSRGVVRGFKMQVLPININSAPDYGNHLIETESAVIVYATAASTVRLPANPEVGDVRYIIGVNNFAVTLNGNGKQIKPGHASATNSVSIIGQSASYPGSKLVIYDGQQWHLLSI